jgi:hypothetical protein
MNDARMPAARSDRIYNSRDAKMKGCQRWVMRRAISDFFGTVFNRLFSSGDPPADRDPYACAPVRNKRGPNDRSSAVAVAEPDDE